MAVPIDGLLSVAGRLVLIELRQNTSRTIRYECTGSTKRFGNCVIGKGSFMNPVPAADTRSGTGLWELYHAPGNPPGSARWARRAWVATSRGGGDGPFRSQWPPGLPSAVAPVRRAEDRQRRREKDASACCWQGA